jgi:subtilisin family serine protease
MEGEQFDSPAKMVYTGRSFTGLPQRNRQETFQTMKDPSYRTFCLALPIALALLLTVAILPSVSRAALPPARAGHSATGDTTVSLPPAPSTLRRATQAITRVYYLEDLNAGDGGYTVSDPESTWEWGAIDSYDGIHSYYPTNTLPGDNVWATNLTGDYDNDEDAYLTSPPIDLSGSVNTPGYELWLQWWQWMYNESPRYDWGAVEARGGTTGWIVLDPPGRMGGMHDPEWTRYRVDVSRFAGASDFQVRFHFRTDISFTYPGWYVDDVAIHQREPPPGVYLSPSTLEVAGCNGSAQNHAFNLANWTGGDASVSLAYELAEPALGSITGPTTISLSQSAGTGFVVTLTPELCLPAGVALVGSVEASANGYSDTTTFSKTIVTGGHWDSIAGEPGGGRTDGVSAGYDGLVWSIAGHGDEPNVHTFDPSTNVWTVVPTSAPPFGANYARSGCQFADRIYVYGDAVTPDFVGLWAYYMSSNEWRHLAPLGTPPPYNGIWTPTWTYDSESGLCYLTGGVTTQTAGTLNTVYVYDPATNTWVSPTLPSFTTARYSHAAWIVGSGGDKWLCVAGGTGTSDLDSTQCCDLSTGDWNGENADLGALPATVTSMGYTQKHRYGTDEQLWLVGGVEGGVISSHAIYYDVDGQTWRDGGHLASGAVRRTSATTLDGQIYRIGGITGDVYPSTASDRRVQCPTCADVGWLAGNVYDHDGVNVPCTNATVDVDPGNNDLPVSASGYYTLATVPFAYQVTAHAAGYPEPDGPYTVAVKAGTVTTRDLRLDRPAIGVIPTALAAEAAVPNTVTRPVTIANSGSYTLQIEFQEVQPPAALTPTPASRTTGQSGILVEPELQASMDAGTPTGYLIYFRDRPDLSAAFGMDWVTRGRFVATALQETAKRSQARVRAVLDAQAVDYEPFWIDNVILVRASGRHTLNSLTSFPEIAALRARRTLHLVEPEKSAPTLEPSAVEPNVSHIEADWVWDMGFRGDGLVVANIDTGVRYTHKALQPHYRGNLGDGSYSHDYNWLDPDSGNAIPYDDHGHGSHTMGIMVGGDGEANQIGVAPGARWIACDACSVDGGCPDEALLTCAQWILAPYPVNNPSLPNPDVRPHVVNNSWGDCATSYDRWFQSTVDAWHAAGIYPVFSNGNASNCDYSLPPGCNTVGNPARYGNVTGVGSTGQSNGLYASHSCWGPTDSPDTVNPRGYPDLKPQVVAPGVGIRSSLNGSDSLYGSWSGTSMSAPHVAALVALMWQAAPCLAGDYATTETIIEQTATPLPYTTDCAGGGEGPGSTPSYATGWGEINARAAVEEAIDYCDRDWLPWVETGVVTGALTTGAQAIEVTFTCNATAALELQPLQGTLLIEHNDPCQEPTEVDLTFFCAGQTPSPIWEKEVWIGDSAQTPVEGPHVVHPGDTVVIVDRVGATYSGAVSSVLTETWNDALGLVSYDTGGLGPGTVRGFGTVVLPDTHSLVWELADVPPNTFYPITKTFQLQHGDWTTGLISEEYAVHDALTQREDVVVAFVPNEPAIRLDKGGPGLAEPDEGIALALVITSDGRFFGNAALTDTLPARMTYRGNVTATHGRAWEENNVIYWTSYTGTVPPAPSPPADVVADGGFEDGTPNDYWHEASINFGTPLCDSATCGTGGGSGPHSGDWWAWFGGTTLTETGSLDQDVTIPPGDAELSFWLEIPEAGTQGFVEASIDGAAIFSATEADADSYVSYERVSLDVSAYADGGSHHLRFESTTNAGAGTTNFFVDDVSLNVGDTDPMPEQVSITFDVWISGTGEICNVAELNWGEDYTSDEHCVGTAGQRGYLPIVLRDS